MQKADRHEQIEELLCFLHIDSTSSDISCAINSSIQLRTLLLSKICSPKNQNTAASFNNEKLEGAPDYGMNAYPGPMLESCSRTLLGREAVLFSSGKIEQAIQMASKGVAELPQDMNMQNQLDGFDLTAAFMTDPTIGCLLSRTAEVKQAFAKARQYVKQCQAEVAENYQVSNRLQEDPDPRPDACQRDGTCDVDGRRVNSAEVQPVRPLDVHNCPSTFQPRPALSQVHPGGSTHDGAGGENAALNKGPGGTAWTSRSHHATGGSSMSLWGEGDAIVTISSDEEEGNRGEESSGEPRKRRGLNNSRRPLPYIQHSGLNSNPVQCSKPYSHNPSVYPKTSQHRQNARQTVEHEMEHPLYGLHNVGGTEAASALSAGCGFVTARTQLAIDMAKKGQAYPSGGGVGGAGGVGSRSLKRQAPPAVPNGGAGVAGGGNCVSRAFTPPSFVQKALNGPPHQGTAGRRPAAGRGGGGAGGGSCGEELNGGQFSERVLELLSGPDGEIPEEIMKLDPKIVEQVSNEILDSSAGDIHWDDIAGQDAAKRLVQEIVVWPMLNPQLFTGARAPPRGLLLFGPPGTGKTLIGKAIASNIKATFFSISSSSLTSKWIGEGEKMVKALFTIARCLQPSVIFIDEIDSILSARKAEGEHESSRRLKTEMLVQMEGCDPKSSGCRVLLIGATNRPEELDDAARRRLPKQLYIPLPCPLAREQMVLRMLRGVGHCLSAAEVSKVVAKTEGYSGSDMRNFVQEACQGPVRDALRSGRDVGGMQERDLRPVNLKDFQMAQRAQKKSVDDGEVVRYEEYNEKHGAKYADQCVSGNDASCMEDW